MGKGEAFSPTETWKFLRDHGVTCAGAGTVFWQSYLAVQQAQGACMPIHEWGTPGAREVALAFNLLLARIQRISRSRRRAVHHDFDDDEIQEAVDA